MNVNAPLTLGQVRLVVVQQVGEAVRVVVAAVGPVQGLETSRPRGWSGSTGVGAISGTLAIGS